MPNLATPAKPSGADNSPAKGQYKSTSTVNYARDHFGHIGWGVTNPMVTM